MDQSLTPSPQHTAAEFQQVLALQRPHKNLFTYYCFACFAGGPLFPFIWVYYYFRYHTLRYAFDEQGVRMSWGILFRREVSLAYARIQDIHLTSNFLERWLGLARIQVSTASGSSSAEMTIEGLQEFELVRDFLYAKMRGGHAKLGPTAAPSMISDTGARVTVSQEALVASLQQISEDLRAVRQALERRGP
jgi:putative membrane protein